MSYTYRDERRESLLERLRREELEAKAAADEARRRLRYAEREIRNRERRDREQEEAQAKRRRKELSNKPCGTYAAYTRHLRRDETPCDECREAYLTYQRGGNPRQPLSPCGTRAAYRRHRRIGEPPCDACRKANADYMREYFRRQAERAAS